MKKKRNDITVIIDEAVLMPDPKIMAFYSKVLKKLQKKEKWVTWAFTSRSPNEYWPLVEKKLDIFNQEYKKMNEKLLNDIKETAKEMTTQDCRATQYPMFVIMVDTKVYVGSDMDYDDYERKDSDYIELSEMCEACTKEYEKTGCTPDKCLTAMHDGASPRYAIDGCPDEQFGFYRIEQEFDLRAGVFFTAKACEEHIKLNNYHYNNPRSYGIGSWRNFEMQNVQKYLIETAGLEVPSQYQ